MNEEQYQLLRSLRLDGQDDQEPGVAEARRAAVAAGLTDDLVAMRQSDLAMRSALAEIAPPAELALSLQAAMREALHPSTSDEVADGENGNLLLQVEEQRSVAKFSRRKWLGVGAGLAASCAIGGKLWWDLQAFTLDRFTREIVSITRRGISLALMSMDKVVVQEWLVAKDAPRLRTLPVKLDALPRKGCQLYDVAGKTVSLECFLTPEMKLLHFFSIQSASLMNPPATGLGVRISRDGDLTLATWAREQQTLLLISHESPEFILEILS